MAVSSLFDSALQAVMRELPHHESGIPYLPGPVKGKIARVMARRGLLCDRNIMAVSSHLELKLEIKVRLLKLIHPSLTGAQRQYNRTGSQ